MRRTSVIRNQQVGDANDRSRFRHRGLAGQDDRFGAHLPAHLIADVHFGR